MVSKESIGEAFLEEVVSQIRAYDTFRVWEKRSKENILWDFLTRDKKVVQSFAGHCQIDPKTVLKIHAYFKAIGVVLEKLSGLLTSVVVNLDDEGNGLVLVYSGRLILVNKTIRDAGRFGFKSIEDMQSQAERFIEKALQLLEKYEEVARL